MNRDDSHRWARFVASLVSFVVVAIALPIGLLAVSRRRFGSGNPLAGVDPPWRWGQRDVGDAMSGPLADDTVIDGIVRLSLCAVWVAVAVIVVTTVVEVVHALRHLGLPLPDIRGLGWAQRIGRFIAVGLIAVLPIVTPATSLASAIGSRPVATSTMSTATPTPIRAMPADPVVVTPASEAPGSIHLVRPGESIYAIAVDLAGSDSSRVIEIADMIIDANLGAEMPGGQRFTNPAYIETGWTLQIPASIGATPSGPVAETHVAESRIAESYVVEQGDTLWDIADEQLGDPGEWTEIWERNDGDDMGGGRTFDDPNLILPGWELDLRDAGPIATPVPVDVAPVDVAPAEVAPETTVADVVEPAVDVFDAPAPVPATVPIEAATTTSTTIAAAADVSGADAQGPATPAPSPDAPSPIRMEHAALLAAGILALVGVRRRQRLRSAMPRHRVPEPHPDVTRTERRLRTIGEGERALRVDVACRAAAWSLIGTGCQIGWIEASADGDLELRLTGTAVLPPPWTSDGASWRLGAEVPVEMLSDDARQVGQPCMALVQLGVTNGGDELIVDLEACGTLAIVARSDQADEVVTAVAASLASSLFAEVAHLIGVSLPSAALLGHRNAHRTESSDAAIELATTLTGTTSVNERTSFELRSLRTGGEMWEPAVVLLQSNDDIERAQIDQLPAPGHGVVVVASDEQRRIEGAPARLVAGADSWSLEAFGATIELTPIGVSLDDLADISEILVDADRALEPIDDADPVEALQWADDNDESAAAVPFDPMPHEIVVGLLGGVTVHARDGEPGSFERSKTVELIAWLATHRDRATRSGARTALWELDVRDATFANVVSEARRALARLVSPPEGEEWVARTLTEQLPVHDLLVTDADLVEERLAHARLQPPSQAIATLRPAVEMVRDMPFAGTSYLWPDAEGITSNLVLLAITAAAEFAGHALSLGETDGVFWATGQGLRVLPGHEELISLRMQAHARAGDLAGVRQEWEAYERVLVADAWSDGEPAPKLLALRRELLSPSAS